MLKLVVVGWLVARLLVGSVVERAVERAVVQWVPFGCVEVV